MASASEEDLLADVFSTGVHVLKAVVSAAAGAWARSEKAARILSTQPGDCLAYVLVAVSYHP